MKNKDIFANRFKPAVYDKKNLIDFKRKTVWMHGIERTSNPIQSDVPFKVFCIFCVLVAGYFIFR